MWTPIYETVILGGGPAGTVSLVWAARHGPLGASPWGAMAGEASFRAQQSRWLYQHGLGEMTYNGTRQWAASQACFRNQHAGPLLPVDTAEGQPMTGAPAAALDTLWECP